MTQTSPAKMSSFEVILDGADHENHEIQIFTFARALTAVGEILYEANEEVNGSRDSIDVRVNAKFIEGSFGFEVDVFQLAENAKNIVEMIGFAKTAGAAGTVGGVLGILSWLKGEQIEDLEDASSGSKVHTSEGRHKVFPKRLAKLATNKKIRAGIENLIRAPLQSKGTSVVKFSQENAEPIVIEETNSLSYVALKRKELSEEDYSAVEGRVKFTAATVKRKTGWKVEYQGTEYTVRMEDELFIERLKNSEQKQIFGKEFLVKFGTRTKTHAGKKTVGYEIERVLQEL